MLLISGVFFRYTLENPELVDGRCFWSAVVYMYDFALAFVLSKKGSSNLTIWNRETARLGLFLCTFFSTGATCVGSSR